MSEQSTKNWKLETVGNTKPSLNGRATVARVCLSIDGEQKAVERVGIDSPRSVKEAANRWAEQFGVDRDGILADLSELGIRVIADIQNRVEKHKQKTADAGRLSGIADAFIESLKPTHHRDREKIYFEALNAEISPANVWSYAGDEFIDAVKSTAEAQELTSPESEPSYRICLQLLKDAARLAANRAIKTLPDIQDIEHDNALDAAALLSRVVHFMLTVRTLKKDIGEPIQTSIFDFATGLRVGTGWTRMYGLAVFCRNESGQPDIAVKGEFLTTELKAKSNRKLAAELRQADLADTNTVLRVTSKVWRAWQFSSAAIDAVAVTEDTANE